MAYKAADAKRKKKGDTGKKYSSPTRTNVSTVVLRSDIPTSNANRTAAKTTAAKRTDPSPRVTTQSVTKPTRFNALNTNVEERPKAQTLLYTGEQSTRSAGKTLNTPQRKFSSDYEGVRKNADYKTGAAYGWRAYREDEERKQQLKRSSSYQRWTQAVGDKPTLQGSDDTKPQRNWTIDQNNTFGYLYNSRDKSNAREYARLVNAENLAKVREAGQKAWQSVKDGQTRLANASYQQSEIQADWLKEVGKTLQSYYTDGVRKSADNQAITAQKQTDGWKTILDSIGQSASNLHNANYQQSKTQVEKVTEIGHSAWKNMGDAASAYSTAQQSNAQKLDEFYRDTARFNTEAFSDYYRNSPGETMAATSGITGSDQTGSSIYGYRNDTSWKEPQEHWSGYQREQYDRLTKDNPELAESYAATINDAYNQQIKDGKLKQIDGWTSQDGAHGIGAWLGARLANQFSGLDNVNQMVEKAALGRNNVSADVSFSEVKDQFDKTNRNSLSNQYGSWAGEGYQFASDVTDALLSRTVFQQKIGNGKQTLNDLLSAFSSFYEGYSDPSNRNEQTAVAKGLSSAGVDFAIGNASEKIENSLRNLPNHTENIVGEAASVGMNWIKAGSAEWFSQQKNNISALQKQYMESEGLSESAAKHKAIKALLSRDSK